MVHSAFAETGMAPLLWQFQFQLTPRVPFQGIDFPRCVESDQDLEEAAGDEDEDDEDMGNNWEMDAGDEHAPLPATEVCDIAVPDYDWEGENGTESADEITGCRPLFNERATGSEPPFAGAELTDADQVLGDRFGFTPEGVAAMARPWSPTDN